MAQGRGDFQSCRATTNNYHAMRPAGRIRHDVRNHRGSVVAEDRDTFQGRFALDLVCIRKNEVLVDCFVASRLGIHESKVVL
jgi:hypothetical protein